MKAMILAAGKGTRVQPITHIIPKPMIPILQKPVMEFLLELLKEHGFKEIMVNVSHLAEEIENYFRDGQRFGVEIAYSFEGRIEDGEMIGDALGSAGGLKKIQDFQNFGKVSQNISGHQGLRGTFGLFSEAQGVFNVPKRFSNDLM